MRLMWKWKMIILGGILVGALVAFTISVLMPHVYEVDMLVENVQAGMDKAGDKAYLGNLQDISNVIAAGAFSQDILNNFREQYKDTLPRKISFTASLQNSKQFARIAYQAVDVEMGKEILSQLFKRLQERDLVRVEHWKKELDGKIEEKRSKVRENKAVIEKEKERITLEAKTKRLEKKEMLAETKANKNAKEKQVKQLQKKINNVAMKRKSDISEKISYLMAEKKKNAATIKNLDKRTSEIKSTIKVIESEIGFLIETRKKLFSTKNEIRDIGVVDGLSSLIMNAYVQLNNLRQKIVDKDALGLQARLRIEKLDYEIKKLRNESNVAPKESKELYDKVEQAKSDIKDLELRAKELSDDLAVAISTETPDKDLEAFISKTEDKVALITEEIVALEANKKKVKNIVCLQSPMSGVSPLTPNTRRNVIIGAVVGLFLSLFLAVFLEYVYKKDGGRGELNR